MKKRIIGLIFLLALAVGALLSLASCGERGVDYMNDELGEYIFISESDYKGFFQSPDFKKPTDADVNREIMHLLYENRDKEAEYNGGNVSSVPVSIGDTVHIYYRGYTLDESGEQVYIDGASNFTSKTPWKLGIGSLEFIPGFEESLIGAVPTDYGRLSVRESGKVEAGEVIYITYEAFYPDGSSHSAKSKRIELGKENTDSIYGKGFSEYFVGKNIGQKLEDCIFEHGDGDAVYCDVRIDYATSGESSPLTVEATFPEDYREISLRGVTAKFDVYIKYINVYNVPEYGDAFVSGVLKLTEEELSKYEGETLSDKHRASILYALTEEAFWDYVAKKTEVKKLPESDVKRVYDEYYYEAATLYDSYYNASFSSLAEYAAEKYSVPYGMNWLDYITERAEAVVAEKLAFYYIARAEGLLPEGETYEKLYSDVVTEYLEYYSNEIYKEELDKITDPAQKEKRLLEIKEEMLEYYGEEYFAEMVYYDYALDDIIALGNG